MTSKRTLLPVLLLAAGCALSACGYGEQRDLIERAIIEDIGGLHSVTAVEPHVNVNTSGKFMTVAVTSSSNDEDELKGVMKEALKGILNDSRIENGTFAMGVFNADRSINIGPSDVGCHSSGTLSSLRECEL